jgi:hypothetical protein
MAGATRRAWIHSHYAVHFHSMFKRCGPAGTDRLAYSLGDSGSTVGEKLEHRVIGTLWHVAMRKHCLIQPPPNQPHCKDRREYSILQIVSWVQIFLNRYLGRRLFTVDHRAGNAFFRVAVHGSQVSGNLRMEERQPWNSTGFFGLGVSEEAACHCSLKCSRRLGA